MILLFEESLHTHLLHCSSELWCVFVAFVLSKLCIIMNFAYSTLAYINFAYVDTSKLVF